MSLGRISSPSSVSIPSRWCGARTASPWCWTSPLTPDLGAQLRGDGAAGRRLAAAHNGRLVDDRGNALDERSLAAIGAQLEAVRLTLAGRGIETGSPLALRLFS